MGIGVVTDEVIAEMVERIVQEVQPEQIYLFGSRARGEAREDSDVDLLVVEREPFGERRSRLREIQRISRALYSFRIPTDILLYSASEYAKWRESRYHIVGHCEREGRLMYGRH
jgi:uncharacterized protein